MLKALEELALQVGTGSDEPRFKPLVNKLKEKRHLRMRFHLQLINALVCGQDAPEDRVQMRDELAECDFLEVTRNLMSRSGGDDIDVQIAIYDQEMRSDLIEMRSDLAESGKGDVMPLPAGGGAPPSPPGPPPMRMASSTNNVSTMATKVPIHLLATHLCSLRMSCSLPCRA